MRLFLAINPTDELRQRIVAGTAPLRETEKVSWVADEKIHLTLVFLGDQSEEVVPRLSDAMARVGAKHDAFDAPVGSIGAFPNFSRPRVIWLGAGPDARLDALHREVEAACADVGHTPDEGPYRAHITLGRVRHRLAPDALTRLRSAADRVRFSDTLRVGSIDLMQSAKGYITLSSAKLRRR